MKWSAKFNKTGLVYTKSKSGSISQCAQSKNIYMCWTAYHIPPHACGQWSFTCADKSYWKEAVKHNLGTRLVNSFSCYSFVSLASKPLPAQITFNIWSAVALVGSCLLNHLACMLQQIVQPPFMLFRPWAVGSASLYSFHTVQAACMPFSQLSNRSARFLSRTTSFSIILKAAQPV